MIGRYNVHRGMSAGGMLSLLSCYSLRWRQVGFSNWKKMAIGFGIVGPNHADVRIPIIARDDAEIRS